MARDRQLLFAEYYLELWNGTEAARRAGYKGDDNTLAVTASRLLRNAKVREHIDRRLSIQAMSADEVLWRLGEQARASFDDFVEFKEGISQPYLRLDKAKELGLLHLIKKLKYNKDGRLEIELYDAQTALNLIGRHHKLFTDKVEHEHTGEVLIKLDR